MNRRQSVPKNGVKKEVLSDYVTRFADAWLPLDLREDGIAEAWADILETAAGVDIRRIARRAIWRIKKQDQRRRQREVPEGEVRSNSKCP